MNLGMVVANYDRSEGTGGYTVELVTRLAATHQVTVYASGFQTPPPAGVRAIRVPALPSRGYATILSFPLAFAAVRQKHDLVHAQGWSTGSADVVTAHIVLAAWRAAARAAGFWPGTGERLFGPLVQRAEGRLIRRAKAVIAPSDKARGEIARCYGRSEGVTVIHHGFPAVMPPRDREAARRRFDCPPSAFLALYVGDGRKGLAAALEAIAAVSDAHLLVIGHADYTPYRAKAESLGIAGRVHWGGPLPSVAEAYAAADVLLQPTIYDSFGLVIAEAMAAGVPPIVSRTAGVSELIRHQQSGWLLGESAVGEATAALLALRQDVALRQRLSAAARDVAARRSWDQVAAETLAVYERAT
jgi:UDP-glucose:(heptosyl)LPS alpha-1,3-glucosyltransferase